MLFIVNKDKLMTFHAIADVHWKHFQPCSAIVLLLFCRDSNDDNWLLPTVSLSEGWVPEISRSFHYWQPAPELRLLPWLENPGNPAWGPHTGKGIRCPSHWINSGKREGRGGENCLDDELALLSKLQVHTQWKYMQERLKQRLLENAESLSCSLH